MDAHEDTDLGNKRLNLIMADHLKYTYKEFTPTEKDNARRTWPELFEADELKDFASPGTRLFLDGIATYETLKKEANDAKDVYTIFSKYEHNGAFSFDLMHSHYSVKGKGLVKWKIYEALGICALACKLISTHWLNDMEALNKRMDNTIIELLKY